MGGLGPCGVVQLAERHAEPVRSRPGASGLCGNDATGIETAQFACSESTLEQNRQNRN